jgi:hypothetical protein
MKMGKGYVVRALALLSGIAYPTLSFRVPYITAVSVWLNFYLPAVVVLFPVMLLLALYSDHVLWLNLVYFFLGLAIGVSIDALLFHSKVSRIAWLFELIGLCVLLAPVVISGTALGWWIGKRRPKFRQGI